MKTLFGSLLAAATLLGSMACQNGEARLTTAGSSARISGQVTLTETVAQNSRAGIEVREIGSGLVTRTDANGSFELFGVNASAASLSFRRAEDGIDAVLADAVPTMNMQIALSKTTAKKRGRGIGHPGREIEGLIKTIGTGSLVIDSKGTDVTVALTDTTVIRKGNTTLTVADLKVGDRVHVKASVSKTDGSLTAVEVKLQGSGDDSDDDNGGTTMTANGTVTAIGANQLTVLTASGKTKKVNVDANTIIKRKGQPFAFADIKVGDKVESLGTRVDDDTLLARKIETQSGEKPRK